MQSIPYLPNIALSEQVEQRLLDHLTFLYGAERAPALLERLRVIILTQFQQRNPQRAAQEPLAPQERLTGRDAILITYGDQVQNPGQPPLQSLAEVVEKYTKDVISPGPRTAPLLRVHVRDGVRL